MQKILFIPGSDEKLSKYPKLTRSLAKNGLEFVPIEIDWNTGDVDPVNYAEQALAQLGKRRVDAVGGFSRGGAGALVLASRLVELDRPPTKLILCSHSAMFDDNGGKHTSRTPIRPLVKTIMNARVEVHVIFGENEVSGIQDRARATAKHFGIEPICLQDTDHNVEIPLYTQTISRILRPQR